MNLSSLYISPLETCNLHCRLCYTRKHPHQLTNSQILDFVDKYQDFVTDQPNGFLRALNVATHSPRSKKCVTDQKLNSITFCGGEVFLLPGFPNLVNQLLSRKIFITIITNGTLDRLSEISDPANCQLLVSLDGPKDIHDANRGKGNFAKTIDFIRHSLRLGFPAEIMFLITKSSYPHLDSLPQELQATLGLPIKFNHITYKSHSYTACHPLSQSTPGSQSLTPEQIIHIKHHYPSIPGPQFGCSQISLQSDGQIYGCCESPTPIGQISDPISQIVNNFSSSLSICKKCPIFTDDQSLRAQRTSALANPKVVRSKAKSTSGGSTAKNWLPNLKCYGCCSPGFLCGYKKELQLTTCQQVIGKFNQQEDGH